MPVVTRSAVRGLLHEFADTLLPQRCLVCGRFGAALHGGCLPALPAAEGPRCPRCWAPPGGTRAAAGAPGAPCERCLVDSASAVAGTRAPFRFAGFARSAILEAKFRGTTALLEPLAVAAARAVPPGWCVEAVLPVPLHAARERQRGYNQAEIVARVVARELRRPLLTGALHRVRAAPPQAGLSARRRATNLRGVFHASAAALAAPDGAAPRLLLVDDVTTTGATFEAAAAALRGAGAETVYALALARED